MRGLNSNLSCVLERENLGTDRVQCAVIDPASPRGLNWITFTKVYCAAGAGLPTGY